MKRLMLMGPLALCLAVGLVACGGDDDESTGAGDAASATASPTGASNTATGDGTADAGSSPAASATSGATGTATSGSGDGSNSGDSADAIDAFKDLTENTDDERYHIIYSVESTSEGEEQTGTWELTQDPPRSSAIVAYEGEDEGKFFVINDGTNSYTCFETGGAGQCIKGSSGDDLGPVNPDDAIDDLEDGESVEEIDGRKVAGRDARCFKFVGNEPADSGTICLDEDTGVMLLLEGDDVLIEATKYDDNIDDSAFEPPFAVIG